MSELRIGTGVDAHALEPGVPLVLGGVSFDSPRGLAGHSDGDVITHALIDALLGAAALGDIGAMFPPDDPELKGVSSLKLLREAYAQVRRAGYELVNADVVFIGQEPRLAPVRAQMQDDARRGARPRRPGEDLRARDDDGRPRLHRPRRGPGGAGRRAARADYLARRFARSSRRRCSRLSPSGTIPCCSCMSSTAFRSFADSCDIACCAFSGSLVAPPYRFSFFIALASSGFDRSIAASEAFSSRPRRNGTFAIVVNSGRR